MNTQKPREAQSQAKVSCRGALSNNRFGRQNEHKNPAKPSLRQRFPVAGRCRITDSDVKMNTKTPRSPVSGKGFLSRGVVE